MRAIRAANSDRLPNRMLKPSSVSFFRDTVKTEAAATTKKKTNYNTKKEHFFITNNKKLKFKTCWLELVFENKILSV
jgi:hypothetical protein